MYEDMRNIEIQCNLHDTRPSWVQVSRVGSSLRQICRQRVDLCLNGTPGIITKSNSQRCICVASELVNLPGSLCWVTTRHGLVEECTNEGGRTAFVGWVQRNLDKRFRASGDEASEFEDGNLEDEINYTFKTR